MARTISHRAVSLVLSGIRGAIGHPLAKCVDNHGQPGGDQGGQHAELNVTGPLAKVSQGCTAGCHKQALSQLDQVNSVETETLGTGTAAARGTLIHFLLLSLHEV